MIVSYTERNGSSLIAPRCDGPGDPPCQTLMSDGDRVYAWVTDAQPLPEQPADIEMKIHDLAIETDLAAEIEARGEPFLVVASRRAADYPPLDALVVALWEKQVEGRDAAADDLQARRAAVKAAWPKPTALLSPRSSGE